jgi:phosphohistidine phosphatase
MKETKQKDFHYSPIRDGGKQLLLIRHAKSDWNDASLSDFDRPLNDRGKRDAPLMAHRLLDRKVKIDLFISSPAKRAKKTASIFAKEYNMGKEEIILDSKLYAAGVEELYNVIRSVKDKFNCIAVFAHNPGLTDFANLLTDTQIDNIPTSAIFAVKNDSKHWADFKGSKKDFWFFDYPKGSE